MTSDVLFTRAGGLRADLEDVNWAATPLGDPKTWSQALRGAVALLLRTDFPATLLWGPEFVLVYNAPYVPILAEKHPSALGSSAKDVFPEAWETIGPWLRDVRAGAGSKWIEDAPVPLIRDGHLNESYFTFCYSAVENDAGEVEGVIDIVTETTAQVVDRRRLRLLSELRDVLGHLDSARELRGRALPVLRSDADDLAVVDVRL